MASLGEFELLVLLSLLHLRDAPYANRVREQLEEEAGRRVTRGALYRTLDRLRAKGLLVWEDEPSAIPERGGHPARRLRVTPAGVDAVRETRDVLSRFLGRVDPLLDEGT